MARVVIEKAFKLIAGRENGADPDEGVMESLKDSGSIAAAKSCVAITNGHSIRASQRRWVRLFAGGMAQTSLLSCIASCTCDCGGTMHRSYSDS